MKRIQYIAILLAWMTSIPLLANPGSSKWEEWGPSGRYDMGLLVRLGYTIGGTTPLPLPAEIRGINSYKPRGGFQFGVEGYKMFDRHWGASLGLYYAYQGFSTSASVKSYYMSYLDGDNITSGWFTGCNDTDYETTGLLIPLLATYRLTPRWNVSVGPFLHLLIDKTFSGKVYDQDGVGYLRVDETDDEGNSLGQGPTGQKVLITRENPACYDESEALCSCYGGLELGFDWKAMTHLNVFGKVDWGLTGAFPSDYKTVRFKMYPIYGTLGVAYRF